VALVGYYGLGSVNLIPWGTVPGGMWWLVLVSTAAFLLGAAMLPAPQTYPPTVAAARAQPINLPLATALIVGLFIISAGTLVLGFTRTGVPLFGNVDVARLQLAASGYLNTLGLAVRAAMVAAAVLGLSLPVGAPRRYPVALFGVLILSTVVLAATGNRGHLVLVAVILMAAWHYLRRRSTLRHAAIIALAGLLVYSVTGYLRSAQCDTELGPRMEAFYGIPATLAPLAPGYLSVRSVPAFASTIIAAVPERHPYMLGRMSAAPLLEVLPGHQEGIDEILKVDILGLSFVGHGVAAGGMVPPYVDFGYVGVVVAYFMVGLLAQALYRRARGGGREWMAVYVFTVGALFLSLYGSLISNFSIVWLPFLLFSIFALSRRRPSAEQELAPSGIVTPPSWRAKRRLTSLFEKAVIGATVASYIGLASVVAISFVRPPDTTAPGGEVVPGADPSDPAIETGGASATSCGP